MRIWSALRRRIDHVRRQTATDTSGIGLWCYSDGEASLPVRKELQSGKTLTSSVGYSLNYNTLDNNKNPTDGLLIDWKQDFAGVGGDVKYIKSAVDAKYYTPLVADIVGLIHVQGGMLEPVRRQRAAHARSLPDGSEPGSRLCAERHRSARHQPVRHA